MLIVKKIILLLILAVFIIGCTAKTEKVVEEKPLQETPKTEEPKTLGPSGCNSDEECISYCSKNPMDCKAWCEVNKEACAEHAINIDIPSGIPESPCTNDEECLTGLCLNFKCDIPSPDNMAKKSGFKLPGSCSSMADCAKYCAQPKNIDECKSFCGNFPSFCANVNEIRASNAPEECKSCISCDSKSCISDCTYNCYAYMPFKLTNIEELKNGFVFERNYKEPIKAVWEPGPANNRNGVTYFVDDYKELGVNTYSITPKYDHKGESLVHNVDYVITGENDADAETTANLIKAKKAGFQTVLVAHDLYDLFPDANPNKNERINYKIYLDDIERTALKLAKIAEEYKSEYFVPVNEFEYMMYQNGYSAEEACGATNSLYQKIIPRVREIFKGKIYCRVGGMDAKFGCMDFSQCDIFGFTLGGSGDAYSLLKNEISVGEQLSAKYGKPYILAEVFSFNYDGIPACAQVHRGGMRAYKEVAKNGIGYTFMGLVQRDPINKNDCTIKEANVVGDYKEFFKWIDENQ